MNTFLHIQIISIVIYRPIFNEFCDGASHIEFKSLEEAEDECSKRENCIGLVDNCGEGKSFYLCYPHQSKMPSRCGSVLYLAPGKLYHVSHVYINN